MHRKNKTEIHDLQFIEKVVSHKTKCRKLVQTKLLKLKPHTQDKGGKTIEMCSTVI